jgi:hypothetical protein
VISEFETRDRTSELFFFGFAGIGIVLLAWAAFSVKLDSERNALVFIGFVGVISGAVWRGWSDRSIRLRKLAERQKTLRALHEAMNTND